MKDINVVVAGAAGEGIQVIGAVLTELVAGYGHAVFAWQEYESRIRGGHSRFALRIGTEPRNAPLEDADVLLALNDKAAEHYAQLVKEGGLLIAPQEHGADSLAVPFAELAEREAGKKLYANSVAVGVLAGALGLELEALHEVLGRRFQAKGDEVVEANRKAASGGYQSADERCRERCPWDLSEGRGVYYRIDGHTALALGAARGGCRFMSAYPMSPSTSIITYLAQQQDRLGIFVEQAEDEIAAINMALGASYAGVRAMTATSGGGFALMTEALSLAGMTETPVVVTLAQRPGPATGLPTRTAQGDLLFAIHAGHGEFPKVVLAPSDPREALRLTVRAFNLADRFQVPVLILTDQFLAESVYSVEDFDLEAWAPEDHRADPSGVETPYRRYRFSDDGISARLYPGQSEHLVAVDSDEHDEAGHITEDLSGTALPMAHKRLAKMSGLRAAMDPPEAYALDDAELVLVGWGSSRAAIRETVLHLRDQDVRAGHLQFTALWPLPDYDFPDGPRYVSVEGNHSGQLARLLRAEYGLDFSGHVGRADGLPLTEPFIRRHLDV